MLKTRLQRESEGLLACVHCGLCLQSCPTYRLLGDESDSPRGRIYLMRAVAEERLQPTASYSRHIDLCLGCRACETACPSGVPYGQLLEAARADMLPDRADLWGRWIEWAVKMVFPRKLLLRLVFAAARAFRPFVRRLEPLPEWWQLQLYLNATSSLERVEQMLMKMGYRQREERLPLQNLGGVALLQGCVMDGFYKATNLATERVLTAVGYRVWKPWGQGCCGALQAHSGIRDVAEEMAKRNIDAFERSSSLIAVNAAGCGAMLKRYGELLKDDTYYAQRAQEFSARVRDVTELLAGRWSGERLDLRVVYDAPCHLYHGQKVRVQPLELLDAAAQLLPLSGSEQCCGSAGIYNIFHPDIAQKLLSEKIKQIEHSGTQVLVTANPGCAMHLAAGLALKGLDIPVLHIIELLDLANRYTRVRRLNI